MLSRQTLKSKREIVRAIIDKYDVDTPFSPEDLKALGDATNTVLAGAWRRKNPEYPGDKRHLHILAYDWPEPRQWSWRKAIEFSLEPNTEESVERRERQRRLIALRQSIRDDLREFRESAEPQECAVCQYTSNLTTDHVKPSFHQIALDFIKIHGFFALKDIPGMSDGFADADLEAHWLAYHASRAVYQLLCRSCNSSKGSR